MVRYTGVFGVRYIGVPLYVNLLDKCDERDKHARKYSVLWNSRARTKDNLQPETPPEERAVATN